MTTRIVALIFTTFVASLALADETAPTLSLSKAAKLAEEAIATASLPANCFLRSIVLMSSFPNDPPSYYQAIYKPRTPQAPGSTLDVIHITMDGKASFVQLTLPYETQVHTQRRTELKQLSPK